MRIRKMEEEALFSVKLPIFDKCNAVRKRKDIVEKIMKKEYHHIHLGVRHKQLTFPHGWVQPEQLSHIVGNRTLYVEVQEIRIELDETKIILGRDETPHIIFERWA